MPKVILIILAIAAGLYALVVVLLYFFQSRLVYFPTRTVFATPSDRGLAYDAVTLRAGDGVAISGWFVPAGNERATVLFLHGNGGNLAHTLETIQMFNQLGLSVLAIDYRGYGMSSGEPSEEGTYLDAEAAWRYLVEERGIPESKIVVVGRSLGGAMATWLAVKSAPAALILESTFTSVADVGASSYPFLPVRMLIRFSYDNLGRIGKVGCPVLVVHSNADEMVPFEHGKKLYEAARSSKEFLEIQYDHNNCYVLSGSRYVDGIDRFLSGLVKLDGSSRRD